MKLVLMTLLLMIGFQSQAALHPYWDQTKKLEAVISSPELKDALEGQKIKSINSIGDQAFQISTESCQVTVQLEAHLPNGVGATKYTVQSISQPNCR